MPKAIAPNEAQTNIARFKRSAIKTALGRLGDHRNCLPQPARRGQKGFSIRRAFIYAIVAEVLPR
jgi:hypothetical protein